MNYLLFLRLLRFRGWLGCLIGSVAANDNQPIVSQVRLHVAHPEFLFFLPSYRWNRYVSGRLCEPGEYPRGQQKGYNTIDRIHLLVC